MTEEMSIGELGRLLADLKGQMTVGFHGVNKRLDDVGDTISEQARQLGNHATLHATQAQKVENLEREVFWKGRNGRGNGNGHGSAGVSTADAVTHRDVKLVWAVLGAVVVLLELLFRIAPVIVSAVRAAQTP